MNGKTPHLGVNALRKRIEDLKTELAGVTDAIAELERNRFADLAQYEERLVVAQQQAAGAKQTQEQLLIQADETEHKGRALISAGEKQLELAREQRADAERVDLLTGIGGPVRLAEGALRTRQEHWKAELAKIQNGAIRRKRSQLEQAVAKLERRAARKAAEPEREIDGAVPVCPRENYGTPSPPAAPSLKKAIAENPIAVATALIASAQRSKKE